MSKSMANKKDCNPRFKNKFLDVFNFGKNSVLRPQYDEFQVAITEVACAHRIGVVILFNFLPGRGTVASDGLDNLRGKSRRIHGCGLSSRQRRAVSIGNINHGKRVFVYLIN